MGEMQPVSRLPSFGIDGDSDSDPPGWWREGQTAPVTDAVSDSSDDADSEHCCLCGGPDSPRSPTGLLRRYGAASGLDRAAALVQDALLGSRLKFQRRRVRAYRTYRSGPVRFVLAAAALMSCALSVLHSPDDRGSGAGNAVWAVFEVAVAAAIVADSFCRRYCMGSRRYYRHLPNLIQLSCTAVIAADLLLIPLFQGLRPLSSAALLSQPCLRRYCGPLLCALRWPLLSDALNGCARAAVALGPVLILVGCFLSLFAVYAFLLYGAQPNTPFPDLLTSLYQICQLLTTNNFPDVMLPMYLHPFTVSGGDPVVTPLANSTGYIVRKEWAILASPKQALWSYDWASVSARLPPLFFSAFILSMPYFMLAVAFAVVYDVYKRALSLQVGNAYKMRLKLLRKAFRALTGIDRYADAEEGHTAINLQPQEEELVTFEQFRALHDEVQRPSPLVAWWRRVTALLRAPGVDEETHMATQAVLFHTLCDDDGRLPEKRFELLAPLMQLRVEAVADERKGRRKSWAEQSCAPIGCVVRCVRYKKGRGLQAVAGTAVLGSVVFAAIHYQIVATKGLKASDALWQRFMWAELGVGLVFDLEVALKLLGWGWQRYWAKGWNRFDFYVTAFNAVIYVCFAVLWAVKDPAEAVALVMEGHGTADSNQTPDLIMLVLLGRILRVLRVLSAYKPFRYILSTVTRLLHVLVSYVCALWTILYWYALLGVAVLGSVTPAPGTEYATSNYYGLRFSSFSESFVTLVAVMVQNNLFIIVDGFLATDVEGAAVIMYFFSFYCAAVLLVVNVVIAFVVDVFQSQWEKRKSSSLDIKHHPLARRIHKLNSARIEGVRPLTPPPQRGPDGAERPRMWNVRYVGRKHKSQLALEWMLLRDHVLQPG